MFFVVVFNLSIKNNSMQIININTINNLSLRCDKNYKWYLQGNNKKNLLIHLFLYTNFDVKN